MPVLSIYAPLNFNFLLILYFLEIITFLEFIKKYIRILLFISHFPQMSLSETSVEIITGDFRVISIIDSRINIVFEKICGISQTCLCISHINNHPD